MSQTGPTIAIVGSGPSGCYSAQFLRKKWPGAKVAVFEALPIPYGLARYGVASDHQGTKAITAQFDRLFERGDATFVGNVKIGSDIPFATLAATFDIVVLATGLNHERGLGIQVDSACSVIGAGTILKALNGHPHMDLPVLPNGAPAPLGRRLAVIGNGNVALDVIRILCKPVEAFEGADIDDERLEALRSGGIEQIDVFGRSQASCAKFDLSMLKELLALPNVAVSFTGVENDEACAAIDALTAAASRDASSDANVVRLVFHFRASPESVVGKDGRSVLSATRADGSVQTAEVDTIITAIGFTNVKDSTPCESAGWTGNNVFRVGWLRREGRGTIADNRRDAKLVVDEIVQAVEGGVILFETEGLGAIEDRIQDRMVSFDGWRTIDEHERRRAATGRCRRKITDLSEMLALAGTTAANRPAGNL